MSNYIFYSGIFLVVIFLAVFFYLWISSRRYDFYRKNILNILEQKEEGCDFHKLEYILFNSIFILSGFYNGIFCRALEHLVEDGEIILDEEGKYKIKRGQ